MYIKLQKNKFSVNIIAIIVVCYSELNCKYYKKIVNAVINKKEKKKKSKKKKKINSI